MSTNDDKYLVLRGKNKDIYFIQKRLSKGLSSLIGKDFIKKSLETTNLEEAREKRDMILNELKELEIKELGKKELKTEQISNNSKINTFNSGILTNNNLTTYDDLLNHNGGSKNKDENGLNKYLNFSKYLNKNEFIKLLDKLIPIFILFFTLLIALLV